VARTSTESGCAEPPILKGMSRSKRVEVGLLLEARTLTVPAGLANTDSSALGMPGE